MKKKIAICISGQARCYDFHQTHHFLFPGCDVDYFCFFWDYKLEPDDHEKIKDVYKPKSLVIEPYIDFSSYSGRVPNAGIRSFNTFPMWYAVMRADLLRQEYERDNGFKYDAVVRSRSDNLFNSSWINGIDALNENDIVFPTLYHFNDWQDLPGYNDQLAIGTSDSMTTYSSMFNWFPTAFSLYPGWWGIERLLVLYFDWCNANGKPINVKMEPVDYKLLRPSEKGKPYEECRGYMHPSEREIR